MARLVTFDGGNFLASGAGYYASVPPSLALSVVSTNFSEGATITFLVTASKPWDEDITVAYATGGGTATAGVDYVAASGTVTIPVGGTTATIDVVTIDRDGVQADRTFTLTLSSPLTTSGEAPVLTTAAQTVTIDDTDVALPVPALVASVIGTGAEEGSPITFRVATQGLAPTPSAITFTYETADGTAINGTDYTATSGNGFIAAGAASQEFQVVTIARSGYQVARTVLFTITSANTTIATATVSAIISDTETPTGSHAYFEAMSARPDCALAYTLRDQAQINGLASGAVNVSLTYAPELDTDPHAVDGMKITLPPFGPNPAGFLSTDITSTATEMVVNGPLVGNWNSKSTQYRIGDEYVISVSNNTVFDELTNTWRLASRGAYGTTASAHAAGTPIYRASNDLINQCWIPLNGTVGGAFTGTQDGSTWVAGWDYLLTSSWMKLNLGGFKTFQFDSPTGGIWMEPQTYFGADGGVVGWNPDVHVANIRARSYNKVGGVADYSLTDGNRLGPGVTDDNPLLPLANGTSLTRFLMYPNRWSRWVCAFDQRANDYDLFSMWVCDEQQAWHKVYDQVPVSVKSTPSRIGRWRIEMDTSTQALPSSRTSVQTYGTETLEAFRDLIAYAKNFFLLRMPAGTDEADLIAEGILGPLPEPEA